MLTILRWTAFGFLCASVGAVLFWAVTGDD